MLREDELELAAGYALGTLGENDRRSVEQRLATGNPELERAIAEFTDAAALLAHATPAAAPPATLRQRVLDAARAEMGSRPAPSGPATAAPKAAPAALRLPIRRSPIEKWSWAFVAAAAAFAIATAVVLVQNQSLRSRVATLDTQIHRFEGEIVDLNEGRRWAEVWRAPNVRVVSFGPTGAGEAPLAGRAAYDPASRRAVITFEQIQKPAGHDYELWAIREGHPVSLGVVHADESGRAEIRANEVGNASELGAFAISLEAEGGSGNPTAPAGPVVMVAKLPG